ncbi:MAG: DnaJ domain-containing protein [Nodosilinea sp.]
MRLDQGLFKLDFDDHHAVLGVPLNADARAIRKRYLAIARKLHPDSVSAAGGASSQRASELLSKWVNPAYEILSQEKSATEHGLMLKLKGQTLRRAKTPPGVVGETAKALLVAPHVEPAYRQAVNALSEALYDQLDQSLQMIGQISELNMIYLYRTTDGATAPPPSTSGQTPPTVPIPSAPTATPLPRRTQATILASYISRAQEYEQDRDYGQAILELRQALKAYPHNAQGHGYLAGLYLKSGQSTMARIHAKRALELNPDEDQAQAVQARLDQATRSADRGRDGSKAADKSSGNGFFGLFGGNKKP